MRIFLYFSFGLFLVACSNKSMEIAKQRNDEGVNFMDTGELEKAKMAFHTALSQEKISDEMQATVSRNLSLLFTLKDEKDSAQYFAKLGYEKAPKNSFSFFLNRGDYKLLSGKTKDAVADFEKAKKMKPEEMASYNSLGMIYSGKYGDNLTDYKKALENNKKAYELAPREPLQEALALSYMNVEMYKTSVQIWEDLLKKNPTNMEYHFQLGVALYFSGQAAKGERKMEYAADRDDECRRMLNEMQSE